MNHQHHVEALFLVDDVADFWDEFWTPERDAECDESEAAAAAVEALYRAELRSRFEERFRQVGRVRYLVAIMARADSSARARWQPLRTAQLWKDISYSEVLELARSLESHPHSVYHFCWFAWRVLHLRLPEFAKVVGIPASVRQEMLRFDGAVVQVSANDWDRERLAEAGVDANLLWRRLREEGAPIVKEADQSDGNS